MQQRPQVGDLVTWVRTDDVGIIVFITLDAYNFDESMEGFSVMVYWDDLKSTRVYSMDGHAYNSNLIFISSAFGE